MTATPKRLSVVVMTSIPLGVEVAAALRALPEVGKLVLLTAPAAPARSTLGQLEATWRYEGLPGLLRAILRRVRKATRLEEENKVAALAARRCPQVAHFAMPRFHSEACRDFLEGMAPDLGVVVGTHILRSEIFSRPRLGSINLHLGAAPEFRGSSPGFYEMLEGVTEVGVTIHRVTDTLDGGNILLQERFPLDIVPRGDPLAYLSRYVADVLCPNGVRMAAAAVAALARGGCGERIQDAALARTRRRATWAQKKELRRVVAGRRLVADRLIASPPVALRRLTFPATEP
jgi:folate-dependent phosphoribosylglycinamide formyltransferase PurN